MHFIKNIKLLRNVGNTSHCCPVQERQNKVNVESVLSVVLVLTVQPLQVA
jgi:hypothetical protein